MGAPVAVVTTFVNVDFDGRIRRVPAVRSRGRLWFHFAGETYVIEPSVDGRRSGPGAKAGRPGVMAAPMPGKVTKVAAVLGANVTKGQVLVVMEAMKMEYTLESDVDGRVSKVTVAAGDQVALGQVLVEVES